MDSAELSVGHDCQPSAEGARSVSTTEPDADPSEADSAEALLSARDITLQYKSHDRLVMATHRVSFDVFAAERFILLGPSGCGKSSLLKSVAGFLPPAEGAIRLRGKPVAEPGPDRMMVFQEFDQLLPWKTVYQNVAFPLKLSGRFNPAEVKERTLDWIHKVGLTEFRDSFPHTLSGGMKQRVAIARAMALEPDILLMDEPFAALDALTRRKMQDELLRLWEDIRFTMLFVTHSIEEAIVVGSRILVLSPHPGRVKAELNAHRFGHEQQGSPEFQRMHSRIHDMLFT
jgi:NitT/TauT family transport system ATP-binding protein